MVEIFLLAVGSMFWPLLLVVVLIALRTSHPLRILCGFLAGGLLTTISISSAIVFALDGTSFVSGSRPPADPWVDIVVGSLCLLAAAALQRGLERRKDEPPAPKKPSRGSERIEGLVERGAPLSFVAGVVLNLLPGFLPIIGMKNIAELNYSTGATFALIVVFYLITFTFVEVPIVSFVVAPEWTRATVNRFNTWLSGNLRRLGVSVLVGFGIAEIILGILAALD
jgi:hypothetical protein